MSSEPVRDFEVSLEFEFERVRSFDGTDLAIYTAGAKDAPPVVLCNGLGANIVAWRALIRRLAENHRVITWDYRGLHGSGPAPDPKAYGIPVQVLDLLALLEHQRAERPVLIGWSMGVQVILELHRTHPDVARAFVALHGTAGRPLRTAFDASIAELVSPVLFGAMRLLGNRLGVVGPSLARNDSIVAAFLRGGRQLGWMTGGIDPRQFAALAEDWTQMDLGVYAETFRQLNEHDAEDLLDAIRTPTLVIAGGRDRFTPTHLSARLAARIPDASLHIVDDATHFGLLEHPEAIGECIEHFLVSRPQRGAPR